LLIIINIGCGIYTINDYLNPPYSISRGSSSFTFYGKNTEDSFDGYIIWYKIGENETYYYCTYEYNGHKYCNIPTIPKLGDKPEGVEYDDTYDPIIVYTVDIGNLYPSIYDPRLDNTEKNMNLNELECTIHIAVSSYGKNGAESEKVEIE